MIPRVPSASGAISAAVVSQATGSLVSFVFTFQLLHILTPREFGLFGMGFALVMIITGFWQGFFITQYIVLAPKEGPAKFPGQVYATMSLVSLATLAAFVAIAAVLQSFLGLGLMALAIGVSAIAFSYKEFHIRHAFSTGRGKQAMLINAVMGAGLLGFMAFQAMIDAEITADLAFVVFAAITGLAAIVGHSVSGLTLFSQTRGDIIETFRKLSVGGKWAVATNLIASFRNNAHIIFLAGLLGPVAVAQVNAARLFVSPPLLLIAALANVILPDFARKLHDAGPAELLRSIGKTGTALFAVVVTYAGALVLAWPYLEPVLVGEQYQGLLPLVATWCVFAAILMIRSVLEWGVQAQRRFAFMTKVSMGLTLLTLLTAWQLTVALGPIGAVAALILTELVMAGAWWLKTKSTLVSST